ncbi:MAG: putative bifunctional diguanylate cyclase/phosphodiesterase [Methylobacter sp.]
MDAIYTAAAADENVLPRKKIMPKKSKKKALLHSQKEALQTLQKNAEKLTVFNAQLSRLIDALPDTLPLKNREGRKLITNKLTKQLFKLHDLDWYGKNGHIPVLTQDAHSRLLLESALHSAIAKGQLKLYYQIQVNNDRQIIGVEALLRWDHPKYGLIIPEQFIAIAEHRGLILPIGDWVLQTACAQLKQWQDNPLMKDLPLAVNISPRQFSHPDFVKQLRKLLKKTGITPALLRLELTETLMLHDISGSIEKMEALQQLGIRFAMDNFGTGYASLSHLKKLPIDQLKIDQFLMRDIALDDTDAMIVKTIIDMTRRLGIGMVAGCVENEQQFACLRDIGCTAYQGYLFGQPMLPDELGLILDTPASV